MPTTWWVNTETGSDTCVHCVKKLPESEQDGFRKRTDAELARLGTVVN